MNLIRSIDLFESEFKLNLAGEQPYKSLKGGVITILLTITTLILTWYFGKDIYLHEQPNI